MTSRAKACGKVGGEGTGAWTGGFSPAQPPRGAGRAVVCLSRTKLVRLYLVDGLRQGLSSGEEVATPRERKQANS